MDIAFCQSYIFDRLHLGILVDRSQQQAKGQRPMLRWFPFSRKPRPFLGWKANVREYPDKGAPLPHKEAHVISPPQVQMSPEVLVERPGIRMGKS